MMKTKNDLPSAARAKMIAVLNARLADAVDLLTQAKQAHFNVKGPAFIGLHLLFDDVAGAVYEYIDLIAERAVQLGGTAEATARLAAGSSSLGEYPAGIVSGADHCQALSGALAAFGKLARQAVDKAVEFNDADTADLFTGVSRGIDKWLWFVEAHLQPAD